MRVFALTRHDGGCSIMRILNDEQTPDDQIARLHPSQRAEIAGWREISEADIPKSRSFRNVWNPDLSVDMPKARDIHMGRIREARNAELDRLDNEYTKESARGRTAEAAAVEAKREALRNIPQTFDLSGAATADDLEALWPAGLPSV